MQPRHGGRNAPAARAGWSRQLVMMQPQQRRRTAPAEQAAEEAAEGKIHGEEIFGDMVTDLRFKIYEFSTSWSVVMNSSALNMLNNLQADKWNVARKRMIQQTMNLVGSVNKQWDTRLVNELTVAKCVRYLLLQHMERLVKSNDDWWAYDQKKDQWQRQNPGVDPPTDAILYSDEWVSADEVLRSRGLATFPKKPELGQDYDRVKDFDYEMENRSQWDNSDDEGVGSTELCRKFVVGPLVGRQRTGPYWTVSDEMQNWFLETIEQAKQVKFLDLREKFIYQAEKALQEERIRTVEKIFNQTGQYVDIMMKLMVQTDAVDWVDSGMAFFTQLPLGVLRDICVYDESGGLEPPAFGPLSPAAEATFAEAAAAAASLTFARFKQFISGMPKSWTPATDITEGPLGSGGGFVHCLGAIDGFVYPDNVAGGNRPASFFNVENISCYFTFEGAIVTTLKKRTVAQAAIDTGEKMDRQEQIKDKKDAKPFPHHIVPNPVKIVFSGCRSWSSKETDEIFDFAPHDTLSQPSSLQEITCYMSTSEQHTAEYAVHATAKDGNRRVLWNSERYEMTGGDWGSGANVGCQIYLS
jgi:hypothetical protein